MTAALIEDGRIVAASREFLAAIGVPSLQELEASGGLGALAPELARLLAAADPVTPLPADVELACAMRVEVQVSPLTGAAGGKRRILLLLEAPGPMPDWPFLAKLSHEVRTPLTSVIGFAELLGAQHLGPLGHERYRGYADDILSSARHALSLVDDLLDIAKIRAGRIDLQVGPHDLAVIAGEAVAAMAPQALAAGVSLTLGPTSAGGPVHVDARSVKQIVLNLIANAIRSTPAGGRVDVTAEQIQSGGTAIVVSDTGPGISPEAIAQALADPFGPGARAAGGGGGLGLPLARELAAANGASLSFAAAPGRGTRIELRFAVNDPQQHHT